MIMRKPAILCRASIRRRSSMSMNRRRWITILPIAAFCLLSIGCRYDMQDQPRYKAYKKSDFFADNRASRNLPEGTVARGQLHDNKAFYTGKIDNPNLNAPV